MKKFIAAILGVAVILSAQFAWADSDHSTTSTSTATATGGAASATGGTHVQTQTNAQTQVNAPVTVQTTTQGQQQGQGQLQGQGQKQSANNEGIKISNPVQDRIPASVGAPGLTSGGSQVCLGSFSIGLSGPMAGIAFGKTMVDSGCERRQHAILLFNMGYPREALELLKDDEKVAALFGPAKKVSSIPAPRSYAEQTVLEQGRFIEVQR